MKKILVILIVVAALVTSCGGHRTVTYRTRPQYRPVPAPTVIYVQPKPHHHIAPPRHRTRGHRR